MVDMVLISICTQSLMNMIGTFLKYLMQGEIVLFGYEFPVMYILMDLLWNKPVLWMKNSSFDM
jgi:hypothetical protein